MTTNNYFTIQFFIDWNIIYNIPLANDQGSYYMYLLVKWVSSMQMWPSRVVSGQVCFTVWYPYVNDRLMTRLDTYWTKTGQKQLRKDSVCVQKVGKETAYTAVLIVRCCERVKCKVAVKLFLLQVFWHVFVFPVRN